MFGKPQKRPFTGGQRGPAQINRRETMIPYRLKWPKMTKKGPKTAKNDPFGPPTPKTAKMTPFLGGLRQGLGVNDQNGQKRPLLYPHPHPPQAPFRRSTYLKRRRGIGPPWKRPKMVKNGLLRCFSQFFSLEFPYPTPQKSPKKRVKNDRFFCLKNPFSFLYFFNIENNL